MHIELLVKMANDIGAFFHGDATAEQAPREVARHIRRNWEPRMRREIVAHWRAGGAGLDEPARSAIALLAADPAASGVPSSA
jgi:formate dehydrogenase subunit delta